MFRVTTQRGEMSRKTATLNRMMNSISDRLKKPRVDPQKSPKVDLRGEAERKSRSHSLKTMKNSSKALYDDVSGHACSTSSHVVMPFGFRSLRESGGNRRGFGLGGRRIQLKASYE